MIESINIRTEGRVIFRDENNSIYKVQKIYNLITTAGRQWVLQRLIGASSAVFQNIELGDDGTTSTTLLDTGVNNLVTTLPVSITDDTANSKILLSATIPQSTFIGQDFAEAALILDDATCFNHSRFTLFTKSASQVDVEWEIIYS